MSTTPVKVFISYSHDSPDHAERVRALADRLRADGLDCALDQYETAPPQGLFWQKRSKPAVSLCWSERASTSLKIGRWRRTIWGMHFLSRGFAREERRERLFWTKRSKPTDSLCRATIQVGSTRNHPQ